MDWTHVPWMRDYARESRAFQNPDGTWHVHNARDFSYTKDAVTKEHWFSIDINPNDVLGGFYYVASLPELGMFRTFSGHTYLGFLFNDGGELIFSIEGRRHEGQKFNTLHGMFGAYEIIHLWGTARDFTERNTIHADVFLEKYDLTLPQSNLQKLLVAALETTREFGGKALTYNTLTNQCTNRLLDVFNRAMPQSVHWNVHWHLPGLSPRLLAVQGILNFNSRTPLTPRR